MKKLATLLCSFVLVLCLTSCSVIMPDIEGVMDLLSSSFSSFSSSDKEEAYTNDTSPYLDIQNDNTSQNDQDVQNGQDLQNGQDTQDPSNSNSENTNTLENSSSQESTSRSGTVTTTLPNYPTAPSLDSIDYVTLINTITTDTIKACVNIRTDEFTSKSDTIPNKSSIGSGVIFYGYELKNGNEVVGYHYYVLTNYHVVKLSDIYPYYYYTIEDYQGVKYGATASWINDEDIVALCKNNDLAILEFESTIELKIIDMETENPAYYETLISIGQPNGQRNAITIGTAEGYDNIKMSDDLIMKNALVHDAPIDHGSSGGAILNTDLKLIGINFAGLFEDNGDFICGYGIPIETVFKFINDFDPELYSDISPIPELNAA